MKAGVAQAGSALRGILAGAWFLAVLLLGASPAEAQPRVAPREAAEQAARRLRKARAALESELARMWKARELGLPALWHGAAPARARVHRHLVSILARFQREAGVEDLVAGGDEVMRRRAAALFLRLLHAFLEMGEAEGLWLEACAPGGALHPCAGLFSWVEPVAKRRRFLAAVAAAIAREPGRTDLEILSGVLRFDALFLAGVREPRRRFRLLAGDLLALFTEIGGASSPGCRLPGRRGAGGFRPEFRDGGDQVRHLAGAFALLALSPDPVLAEGILVVKEMRDAWIRRSPLNHADLRLDRAVRRLVEALLRDPTSPSAPMVLPDREVRLLRRHLAPGR